MVTKQSAYDFVQQRETLESLRKLGFFGSLIGLVAKTVLPFAAISGVLAGVGEEGPMSSKVLKGAEETVKNIVAPGRLISNIVGWTAAPAAIGAATGIKGGVAGMGVNLASGLLVGGAVDKLTGVTNPAEEHLGQGSTGV